MLLQQERPPVIPNGSLRRAVRLARAVMTRTSSDGLRYYHLKSSKREELLGWYNSEGELLEPEKLLTALEEWEGAKATKAEKGQVRLQPDLLSAYRRKVLAEVEEGY